MKKFLILFISAFCWTNLLMAQSVKFSFDARSTVPAQIKNKVEKSISSLLTEINNAGKANRNLSLGKIQIEYDAKKNLEALWENMHFVLLDNKIVQRCLMDDQGFQVRDIASELRPIDDTFSGDLFCQLVISFNHSGYITGVRTTRSNETFDPTTAVGVTDARRRLEILKFVEDFRCYYIEKNVAALEKIFADDALIITGSVIKQQTMTNLETPAIRVKYRKEDKTQYINRLRTQVFKNNRYIDVKFDRISILRSGTPGKECFYGVTLHQDWSSIRNGDTRATADHPSYHDEGWLFLLWEFHDDGTPPVIHVRSWQPDELINTGVDKIDMEDFQF